MKNIVLILSLFIFISCAEEHTSEYTETNNHKSEYTETNNHKFIVDEVIQTTSYTYLLANENNKLQWLALPKIEASKGDVYYYEGGMEMTDFKSNELNRTFASVLFLQKVQSDKFKNESVPSDHIKPKTEKQNISITPVEGTISIAELFGNANNYANKIIKIQGKVVKFNGNIMGKNWIHIQDGTENNGKSDLTITTDQKAKVGEVITVEGKITMDKDFGSGYLYAIIMEEAKLVE